MTEHDAKQNMSLVTQEMPPPGDAPDVQEPLQAPPLCCTAARFLPSLSLAVSFITPPTSSSPSRHPPPLPPPRPLAAARPTGASKDCDAGVGCGERDAESEAKAAAKPNPRGQRGEAKAEAS